LTFIDNFEVNIQISGVQETQIPDSNMPFMPGDIKFNLLHLIQTHTNYDIETIIPSP